MFAESSKSRGVFGTQVNICDVHRCLTGLYIGLRDYGNFQSEAKVEQIITILQNLAYLVFIASFKCEVCSLNAYTN